MVVNNTGTTDTEQVNLVKNLEEETMGEEDIRVKVISDFP